MVLTVLDKTPARRNLRDMAIQVAGLLDETDIPWNRRAITDTLVEVGG